MLPSSLLAGFSVATDGRILVAAEAGKAYLQKVK